MTEPKYLAKARAYLRKQYVRETPHLAEINRALRILDKLPSPRGPVVEARNLLHQYIEDCANLAHPEPSNRIGIVQHTLVGEPEAAEVSG